MKAQVTVITWALLFGSKVASMDPIIAKGNKFFYENGTQFYMKGIAYQKDPYGLGGESGEGTYHDPLASEADCKRDIPILVKAGTNTIRTYQIDPKKNHDACMRMLQDAGIYVVSDLGEPAQSINRDDPSWTVDLFDRYKGVVDALAQYPNFIGGFAGNEVSNNGSNTPASAFVKAAVRDVKKHIRDQGYRWIGIGYAANDDPEIRANAADYFNCGTSDESIDFWGYNLYSWCGENTLSGSGYDKQVEFFADFSVPVFLAEYGCNVPDGAEGRLWQDTDVLYDEMSGSFSGGIAYMFHQEENNYGLVKIEKDGKAKTMKNYDILSSRVANANPTSTFADDYSPTLAPAACPTVASTWEINPDVLPPSPDRELCECMYSSLSCVPATSLDTKEYGDIFGFICGSNPALCAGIKTNTTLGIYGAYSMCNSTQKLGFVMNEHYQDQNEASTACDHNGNAEIRSASAPSSCSARLEDAASDNAFAATATQAPTGGSSNRDDNSSLASSRVNAVLTLGEYAIGVYILGAVGLGSAMVIL